MLTLYDTPLSLNCYKVRLLLSLLGIDYRRQTIDLVAGEHRTQEFLALNPFEWLALEHPTLADVAAFPAWSRCGDGGIGLGGYDAIRAWLDRVRRLEGFVDLRG